MTGVTTNFIDMFKEDIFLLGDFADFFCGDVIGQGETRSVYEYKIDPRFVIKIDRGGCFNNVAEWDIWNNLKNTPHGNFLAPCISISSCGRIMMQRRTTPAHIEKMPKSIPSFFTDTKLQNWGRLGNLIVCHDFANHKFYTNIRMINASWWSLKK